jgi:hypothetical protein
MISPPAGAGPERFSVAVWVEPAFTDTEPDVNDSVAVT